MTWTVVINHKGDIARLPCVSRKEAELVRQSFVNWGGMGYDIRVVVE